MLAAWACRWPATASARNPGTPWPACPMRSGPDTSQHGARLGHYRDRLCEIFPDRQFVLRDPGDETVLAGGRAIPVARDGTDAGLTHLIAPARPALKDRSPAIAIGRCARGTRPGGTPFDPWMRGRTQLGARIGPAIPRSLHIVGTAGDWESWTGMRFPQTGDYVVPGGAPGTALTAERQSAWPRR
jgi:hypothetical protein